MAEQQQLSSDATMIERIIVDQGLATREQVEGCLSLWRQGSNGRSTDERLGELMVSNGVVTASQWDNVRQQAAQIRSPQQIPGYEILERLGEGAMATVYKARQLSLDRIVAIKLLPKRYTSDAAFVERFYAEGRAAAKLNHPNIVQAFDVQKGGEHHYFVMEYVEGHTVYDHLKLHGKYDESEALRIIIQMVEALNHAHQKGFIHRDVKPKNIMIASDGVAKLADMGLARQITDKEAAEHEAGKAYGTPFYISPEQIRGAVDIDLRADIYGLGATFYNMVTGKAPFTGPNPSAVMHKHLREDLTPPDHVNPELSAGVGEIIEMMMAKDRDERYASGADLMEDLDAVKAGRPPVHARKKFDLSSLSVLEDNGEGAKTVDARVGPTLTDQTLFWIATASIVLNLILMGLLIYGL